jgi:EmrB/QacA subfamily drug resistance transporter
MIIAGLMTGMLLGAMDQTIVATAGPTIISDLGGLSLYAWVFSAYILTQTVSMPIFGKLSDLYGRRKFFLFGLVIFMAGSILSGAAQDIDQLIIFRALQGIGSGAFFPVAIAIVGATFPPAQRGKVQGVFASVFGIAAVVGPSAGSYIVQAVSWRWIFYINLPLGVISIILILLGLKESRSTGPRPTLDWLGISTLTAWVGLLIFGFLNGGTTYAWSSWQEAGLFTASAVLFITFLLVERKAKEPVIPLNLFRIRTISSASAVSFMRGIAFFAVVTFIPLFVQAALAGSVSDSRNVLNALLLPMILGALVGGQLSTRVGYRQLTVVGMLLFVIGAFEVTSFNTSTNYTTMMEVLGITGIGIGLTFPTVVLAIQYSVGVKQIGIASSLAQFMGNLGSTIGLAVLGSIQTNSFSSHLGDLLAQVPQAFRAQAAQFLGNVNLVGQFLSSPSILQKAEAGNPALAQFVPSLRDAFAQSLTPVFWFGFIMSLVAFAASLFMTGSFKQQMSARNGATVSTSSSMAEQKAEGTAVQ